MKTTATAFAAVLLLAGVTHGDPIITNDLDAALSTVVPVFTVTNTTPQAAISNLTAVLQQMEPPRRLPVVLAVHPEWMENQPTITFSATQIRVDEILSIISQISNTKFLIMHGAAVLKEIEYWDWTTYQQRIGDRALRELGLTPDSTEEDVMHALQHYGIRFTPGCNAVLMRRIGLGEDSPDVLDVLLTLEPDDAAKARGIILLLEQGFKIEKPEPPQAESTVPVKAAPSASSTVR